jgi:hypothetical protein
MREWMYIYQFLDLGTSWRLVYSFTPRPLYHRRKSPRYLEVGWTPEPVWTTWKSENSWHHRDSSSEPSVVQPVANRYTDWAIPAPPILSSCKNALLHSILILGPTYRWIFNCKGVKRPECEADRSLSSSAEIDDVTYHTSSWGGT